MTDRYEIVAEKKSAALWAVWDLPQGSDLQRLGALYYVNRHWRAVCFSEGTHILGVGPSRRKKKQALEDLICWWHGSDTLLEEEEEGVEEEEDCGVEELRFE